MDFTHLLEWPVVRQGSFAGQGGPAGHGQFDGQKRRILLSIAHKADNP